MIFYENGTPSDQARSKEAWNLDIGAFLRMLLAQVTISTDSGNGSEILYPLRVSDGFKTNRSV